MPPAEPAPAAPLGDTGLAAALRATERAEQLQREAHAHREHAATAGPELSEHKKRFLAAHPEMYSPVHSKLMAAAYHEALAAGYHDDTQAMDEHLLATVHYGVARLTEEAAANVRPAGGALIATPAAPREPVEPVPPMMPAPPRPRIPFSAPVSRESYSGGTGQPMNSGKITLSPEEREIAKISFPHLPQSQAELAYGRNKARMEEMKKDGRIQS
jgi:hypothetical protein